MRKEIASLFKVGIIVPMSLVVLTGSCKNTTSASSPRDIVQAEQSYEVRVVNVDVALNNSVMAAFGRRLCLGSISGTQFNYLVWSMPYSSSCGTWFVTTSGLRLAPKSERTRTTEGDIYDLEYEGVGGVATLNLNADQRTTVSDPRFHMPYKFCPPARSRIMV